MKQQELRQVTDAVEEDMRYCVRDSERFAGFSKTRNSLTKASAAREASFKMLGDNSTLWTSILAPNLYASVYHTDPAPYRGRDIFSCWRCLRTVLECLNLMVQSQVATASTCVWPEEKSKRRGSQT